MTVLIEASQHKHFQVRTRHLSRYIARQSSKIPEIVEISTRLATPKTTEIPFSMKNSPQLVQYTSYEADTPTKQKL